MDEQQYKRLAQICDKLLFDQPDNIYRIAINWLHVPRADAFLLAKYENPQNKLCTINQYQKYGNNLCIN